MDSLFKIVRQLTEDEYNDIHQNLISNKAEKSALFLETLRTSDDPYKEFLDKKDISTSAFYVLKSRLNQKVEDFLLNKLGDPELEVVHKVLKVNEVLFDSPREIAISTLKKMEKTMIDMDNPSALIMVYRGLKLIYNEQPEQRQQYEKLYTQSIAYYLGLEKGIDYLMHFFRTWSKYYLGRKEKDFNDLIGIIEKMNNLNHLYESKKLFIYKAIIQLYSRQFLELPEHVFEILDPEEECFEESFEILKNHDDDLLFKNLNLIFDYLRYVYYENKGEKDKANLYFEILDYKLPELLGGFNFGMDCSQILFHKLERHLAAGTMDQLLEDENLLLQEFSLDSDREIPFLNYNLFRAYVAFYAGKYNLSARILYRLRNEINLRKFPHMNVEVKMFQALVYVIMDEVDLSNQLLLSLQRQLKKPTYTKYDNAKAFLRVLTKALGAKTSKKSAIIQKRIEDFNELNVGSKRVLPHLRLTHALFESKGTEG